MTVNCFELVKFLSIAEGVWAARAAHSKSHGKCFSNTLHYCLRRHRTIHNRSLDRPHRPSSGVRNGGALLEPDRWHLRNLQRTSKWHLPCIVRPCSTSIRRRPNSKHFERSRQSWNAAKASAWWRQSEGGECLPR